VLAAVQCTVLLLARLAHYCQALHQARRAPLHGALWGALSLPPTLALCRPLMSLKRHVYAFPAPKGHATLAQGANKHRVVSSSSIGAAVGGRKAVGQAEELVTGVTLEGQGCALQARGKGAARGIGGRNVTHVLILRTTSTSSTHVVRYQVHPIHLEGSVFWPFFCGFLGEGAIPERRTTHHSHHPPLYCHLSHPR